MLLVVSMDDKDSHGLNKYQTGAENKPLYKCKRFSNDYIVRNGVVMFLNEMTDQDFQEMRRECYR